MSSQNSDVKDGSRPVTATHRQKPAIYAENRQAFVKAALELKLEGWSSHALAEFFDDITICQEVITNTKEDPSLREQLSQTLVFDLRITTCLISLCYRTNG